jgi:alpha-beta hydrolase superfamily lysophospholipase
MYSSELEWKANDGIKIYAKCWEPEKTPLGVICLVHGLGEHSGRYEHVASTLADAGYATLAFDLRGHGRSGGPRGHTPSFEAFMGDIDELISTAESRFPGIPLFLYGHSLGGILVLGYALRRKSGLAGVIATGPGLKSELEQQKLKVALVRLLGSVVPGLQLPSGLVPEHISRDPEVVAAYQSDPLVHDRISVGFGAELIKAIRWEYEHAPEFCFPLLIMHGEQDQLGDPQGSVDFARLCDPQLITLKIWEGLSHEIHNSSTG